MRPLHTFVKVSHSSGQRRISCSSVLPQIGLWNHLALWSCSRRNYCRHPPSDIGVSTVDSSLAKEGLTCSKKMPSDKISRILPLQLKMRPLPTFQPAVLDLWSPAGSCRVSRSGFLTGSSGSDCTDGALFCPNLPATPQSFCHRKNPTAEVRCGQHK